MRFSWVSREMHVAVCAEKDRLIAALREQIFSLEKRVAQPVAVTVTLPKDFAVIQPAIVSRPSKRKKAGSVSDPLPAAPNIDLADVDENSPETLASLAVQKYGRRAHNAWELSQWVRGIQVEVRAAKAQKRRRVEQDEPAPKVEELQTLAELDTSVEESRVPQSVLEKIEAAERGDD